MQNGSSSETYHHLGHSMSSILPAYAAGRASLFKSHLVLKASDRETVTTDKDKRNIYCAGTGGHGLDIRAARRTSPVVAVQALIDERSTAVIAVARCGEFKGITCRCGVVCDRGTGVSKGCPVSLCWNAPTGGARIAYSIYAPIGLTDGAIAVGIGPIATTGIKNIISRIYIRHRTGRGRTV